MKIKLEVCFVLSVTYNSFLFKQILVIVFFSLLNDTHREKAPSNKTQALTKSMNMEIWEIK